MSRTTRNAAPAYIGIHVLHLPCRLNREVRNVAAPLRVENLHERHPHSSQQQFSNDGIDAFESHLHVKQECGLVGVL